MSNSTTLLHTVSTVEYDEATGLLLWVEDDKAPAWQPTVETPTSIFDELLSEIRKGGHNHVSLSDEDLEAAEAEAMFTDWRQ